MSEANEQLERLISRFLDDEATDDEQRRLRQQLRRNPGAQALFEETAAVDREARLALRRALGRPAAPVARERWQWIRLGGMAIAACVAAAVWFSAPAWHTGGGDGPDQAGALPGSGSWFAPLPTSGDTVRRDISAYESPHLRVGKMDRKWIVVPGRRRGEYILIEVDRTRAKCIPVRRDF